MSAHPESSQSPSKATILTIAEKHRNRERIAMVTAYDYPTARLADEAGADAILVGDSLAMVVLGHQNTLAVTMDEMIHHTRAVARGALRALLIGDMPFLSYQADNAEAVRNAGRFVQAGMASVKLEGGRDFAETTRAIVRAGIPVMGHIGLTPQSMNRLGGFRVQGKTAAAARALLDDARSLEDAGCFALVLESVPERLAAHITERIEIPTIGIGAGAGTSGQVLVLHDLLGLSDHAPRFARRYADLREVATGAVKAFCEDVRKGSFPTADHAFRMPDEEWRAFIGEQTRAFPRPIEGRKR